MSRKKKTSASGNNPSKKAASTQRSSAKTPTRAVKPTAALGSQAKNTVVTGKALMGDVEVKRIQTLLLAKTPAKVKAGLDRLKAVRGKRTDYEVIFNESVTRALVCDSALSEQLVSRWEVLIASLRRFPTIISQIKRVATDAVANFEGNAELPGLQEISDVSAEILSAFGGDSLGLGLKRLSVGVAQGLARYKGVLWLGNIRTLSAGAAKTLATSKGELFFGGLTELSGDAAKELSKYRGEALSLYGLTKISDQAAAALAKHVGRLDLNGIERLSITAAQALGRHRGPLNLTGLSELPERAVAALTGNKDILIPREFRTAPTPRLDYSDRDVLALEGAASADEAIALLKRLKRFSAAPSDEIFGDDPTWWFDGQFGTHAPVELGDYSEHDGLSLLEVSCREDAYTLIGDRSHGGGWMRDMLVIMSILNAELERDNRPDRVYSIIQPSWPAILLLDDRLATAAQILRHGEDGALSQAELEREYEAATKGQQRVPWRQQ